MKTMFTMKGNVCGGRIRLGRAMHNSPLTQEELAKKIQLESGLEITKIIISRIEKGERHVIDQELRMIAQALNVSMNWLVGDADKPDRV
ncbi:MAG: helix-turn-helix domain-containing protein [Defluviitaleaceae bacterium]|nr:helix-turn-helix domain-containing protein [Defluviitaleaceae bacterium]